MKIDEGTHIFPNVNFGRGGNDPITIGRNCVLTGCTVIGHDASTNQALGLLKNQQRSMVQPVVIEDDCFIGHAAIILMGVTVGRGSIVGAGAVVAKNVPAGSVVAGNPARIVGSLDQLVERRKRMAIEYPELFPDKPPVLHNAETG